MSIKFHSLGIYSCAYKTDAVFQADNDIHLTVFLFVFKAPPIKNIKLFSDKHIHVLEEIVFSLEIRDVILCVLLAVLHLRKFFLFYYFISKDLWGRILTYKGVESLTKVKTEPTTNK